MFRNYLCIVVLSLTFIAATAAAATPSAESASADSNAIDHLLSDAFHSDAPGAAVLAVRGGQVLLRKGYGLANLELGVPVEPTQVFRICSITKQFTAVAILQLVEAGKIKLDDPISLYLPDYPTARAKVTLAQLLAHTSGIPSLVDAQEWAKMWRDDMTVSQLLGLNKDKPLDFPPGTDWKYSNTGYVLLGAVIEKVSGQNYPEYIQSHIFAPAGMTSSYYDTEKRVIPHRVPGYVRDGKTWVNAPYISMTQPYSAGSLLSTVDDLWKWEQALAAGKLLGPAILAKAYTQVLLPDGRGTNYGFGWELGTLGSHATTAHAGGMPGFTAYELRIPDADIYIAILCNGYGLAVSPRSLAARIARLALNEPAPEPATLTATALQDYAGKYNISSDVNFTIIVENGKLIGQLGPGKRPLTAAAIDEFTSPGEDMRFKFLRDSSHRVDRVLVRPDAPGPDLVWLRINPLAQ